MQTKVIDLDYMIEVINTNMNERDKALYLYSYCSINDLMRLKKSGDFRLGDIAHNVADISKAKELLNFKVTVDLENGLTQFCNWVKGQEHDNSGYENSLCEMEKTGMFFRK